MVDVGGCHGELGGGEQWGRARSEETRFTDHVFIVASWPVSELVHGKLLTELIMMGDCEGTMTIGQRIQADIIVAMKAKDEHKLTTLRMVKSALKNKEIDKREALTDAEENQILTTLIKQRRESVESFTKGGRPELAAREQTEIGMIEGYLPQAAGEDEIRAIVHGAIAHLQKDAGGVKPGPKDMGVAMNVVKQRLLATGLRADGKLVSELVKAELNNG
jgi:uncharacterized protein YqeY